MVGMLPLRDAGFHAARRRFRAASLMFCRTFRALSGELSRRVDDGAAKGGIIWRNGYHGEQRHQTNIVNACSMAWQTGGRT